MTEEKFSDLISVSKTIALHSLAEGAATDAVDSFPMQTLREIEDAGLLTDRKSVV